MTQSISRDIDGYINQKLLYTLIKINIYLLIDILFCYKNDYLYQV